MKNSILLHVMAISLFFSRCLVQMQLYGHAQIGSMHSHCGMVFYCLDVDAPQFVHFICALPGGHFVGFRLFSFCKKCSCNMYKTFSRICPRSAVCSLLGMCICNLIKFVKIVLQNNFPYLLNSRFPEFSPVLYIVIIFHFCQAKNIK